MFRSIEIWVLFNQSNIKKWVRFSEIENKGRNQSSGSGSVGKSQRTILNAHFLQFAAIRTPHQSENRVLDASTNGEIQGSEQVHERRKNHAALLLGERERYADAELRSWAHKAAQSRKKGAISFTEDELFAVLKESVGR